MFKRLLIVCITVLLFTGCDSAPSTELIIDGPTPPAAAVEDAATTTPSPTETAVSPTPTPEPLRVWIEPAVPALVRDAVEATLDDLDALLTEDESQAGIRVRVAGAREANPESVLATWVYAAVVPFPVMANGISWDDVEDFWAGEPEALDVISEDDTIPSLYVPAGTLEMLQSLLGEADVDAPVVEMDADEILDLAWDERPYAWSIVPFDELAPRWKVLRVDDMDLFDRDLDLSEYPLTVAIIAEGEMAGELMAAMGDNTRITNRDTEQMTVLIMTGVTALVRATAHEMEVRGVLYPAELIGPTLRSADLLHISNEIPFASSCPPPNRNSQSLVFCSDPKYIELLRHIGTDIIELTGNHFQDWGSEATLDTLEMYREEGWPYYGGGADLEDARKAMLIEHNDNSFSFIGCNPVGPEFAWATNSRPGAAPCDYEFMHAELSRLADEVDVPIATWQYWEFYHYEATPQQKQDFRAMADAGAVIVSGSQAHHPQAIEFYNDSFIHYGLGNLFFDQMWSLGTRQIMVDRHVIYGGRHISTELLTYMLENWSQPRPTTEAERRQLLGSVFSASGW
jgi:poly-gamma-glutamate synthesis protein (capsule biosynthesis protein)